jgi:membrane-bound inhibitor of C-type lysozyme
LGTGEGIDLYKMSNEPMLNYPVPDIIVAVNSPDSSIDLSNVFYAPIDDPATLSLFSQTNTSLITANIDGNELTLSFATDQIGTDTITVLASASETSVADQFIVKVIPNLVVNNSIPDITVIATAPNTTIDLSTVFYAIDGDTISYSIQNQTNPSLVTASIEGQTLTLDYNDALTGSDTITVLATIDGSSITDEFVVTVNPATAISTNSNAIPVYYSLSQNYPNPFNPETTIGYAIPANAQVVISIYDVNGRLITDILNAQKSAGYHTVKWNASNMSSGIYFYQIKADNFRQIKKCILIK